MAFSAPKSRAKKAEDLAQAIRDGTLLEDDRVPEALELLAAEVKRLKAKIKELE